MTFAVTEGVARVAALVVLMVIGGLLHLISAGQTAHNYADLIGARKRGLKGLVMGSDGRASTSKLQATLWTAAILYSLTFLLLWGRAVGCSAESAKASCQDAERGRGAFSRQLEAGLDAQYYVLLGFPFAAALAAKSMTSSKVADETLEKKAITENDRGIGKALGEVITNDDGESDLLDFQYFAFTLLTLGFFFIKFLGDPSSGLPNLPPTLIALSGLSTAGYTTKKALETWAWDRQANRPIADENGEE